MVRRLLPRGTGVLGIWLVVSGLGAYAFLAVAGRALGADRYGALSALWSLGFVATSCFFPVEQEVTRAVAERSALELGGEPVVRKAAAIAAAITALLALIALGASSLIVDEVFDGQRLLLLGLILLIASYAVEHLVRGILAGRSRFGAYGLLLGGEAGARLLGALTLALVGVSSPGPYGIVFGLAALVGVAVSLIGQHHLLRPGPPAQWSELSRLIGWLILASVFSQILINGGPVVAQVLAGPGDSAVAGRYFASLVVARVPVFFFQAVQASAVPEIATLAASGDRRRVQAAVRRLVLAIGGLGVIATVGLAVVGPVIVRLAFGNEFAVSRVEFALLAAGACAFLLALTLAQGLVALARPARSAAGFALGVGVFAGTTALVTCSVSLRLAIATLAGAIAAAVLLGVQLSRSIAAVTAPAVDPDGGSGTGRPEAAR